MVACAIENEEHAIISTKPATAPGTFMEADDMPSFRVAESD
jgi:hypothetical protein